MAGDIVVESGEGPDRTIFVEQCERTGNLLGSVNYRGILTGAGCHRVVEHCYLYLPDYTLLVWTVESLGPNRCRIEACVLED